MTRGEIGYIMLIEVKNVNGGYKMPVSIAPRGAELCIRKVGADDKVKKHLYELGITEGSKITLVSSSGGNVIVVVKEGRLCLDKNLASKILVA